MATKSASSKSTGGKFPMGGKGKMAPQQGANPAKSGVISNSSNGKGAKFPMGGSGKMFGKGSARPAPAGRTAKGSQ